MKPIIHLGNFRSFLRETENRDFKDSNILLERVSDWADKISVVLENEVKKRNPVSYSIKRDMPRGGSLFHYLEWIKLDAYFPLPGTFLQNVHLEIEITFLKWNYNFLPELSILPKNGQGMLWEKYSPGNHVFGSRLRDQFDLDDQSNRIRYWFEKHKPENLFDSEHKTELMNRFLIEEAKVNEIFTRAEMRKAIQKHFDNKPSWLGKQFANYVRDYDPMLRNAGDIFQEEIILHYAGEEPDSTDLPEDDED